MNYELAKQLKDAGCPSRKHIDDILIDKRDGWIFPTLEELIEACGEQFVGVSKMLDGKRIDGWYAVYIKPFDSRMASVEGSTPTEAVAYLWLALNKKPV